MDKSPFIIGIDLGTTNTAMAFCDTRDETPQCVVFDVPQITAPGVVSDRKTLPSFIYIPGEHELPPGSLELPWGEYSYTAGEFAREQGSRVPNRLVSSAKSWLCNNNIDREGQLLPWTASTNEMNKISPVEASMRYLMHLTEAWHTKHKPVGEERFGAQSVFLTVPASFDASARELTVKAAIASDMEVVLLEEPQAALYSWLYSMGDNWRNVLSVGDTVLVCDVGGGTTDFSLIAVVENEKKLELQRVAVGDHILLGGDNMDLALAAALAAELKEKESVKLDTWQFNALSLLCRSAKEQLFTHSSLKKSDIVIPGRGSKLVGGSIKASLTRETLEKVLMEGFFPITPFDRHPVKKVRSGLIETALPYESEPSVSAHLAKFLSLHSESLIDYGNSRFPKAILFNGGVFRSQEIKNRMISVVKGWFSDKEELKVLENADLDLAVCKGAAYYGLARRGEGIKIRGGLSRSYYIGIESSMPAIPGFEPPLKAVCLASQGIEEGTKVELPDREFGLAVGDEAEFRFLSSSVRRDDKIGDMIEDWDEEEMTELPPMKTELALEESLEKVVPVFLETHITEIGTIELWCVNRKSGKKWKLEFDIRKN